MIDDEETKKPSREELIDMLEATIDNIEKLPNHAMYEPITHADFWAALILIKSIFRSEK
jgi:hypothetical protein